MVTVYQLWRGSQREEPVSNGMVLYCMEFRELLSVDVEIDNVGIGGDALNLASTEKDVFSPPVHKVPGCSFCSADAFDICFCRWSELWDNLFRVYKS